MKKDFMIRIFFTILIISIISCKTDTINLEKSKEIDNNKLIIIGKWIRKDIGIETKWSYSQIGILINIFRRCYGFINNIGTFKFGKNGFYAIELQKENFPIAEIKLGCVKYSLNFFGGETSCFFTSSVIDLSEFSKGGNQILVLAERNIFFNAPTYWRPFDECKPFKIEKKENMDNFLAIIKDFRNNYPEYRYIKKFTLENKQTIFLNN